MYIDVSFPPPSSAPHLDIRVHRQSNLGVVRLQSDACESELKVRQKERVPSRFDTRLWLTSCTDVCNLKPSDSNEELKAPFQTDAKTFSSEAIYSKVANFLVTFSIFFGRSEEHQKFVAGVKLNWNSTEQSPQNQIGAPDQLYSELNLRPPDCNRTTP